jgi:hypothetical protein
MLLVARHGWSRNSSGLHALVADGDSFSGGKGALAKAGRRKKK